MNMESGEGFAHLRAVDLPAASERSGFELLARCGHVGPPTLSEEVEVLRRASREPGCEECSSTGQQEPIGGWQREEQPGDVCLEVGEPVHWWIPSSTGCQAARTSLGSTSSPQRSTSSAPSTYRSRSSAMPSRSVTS